MKRIIAQILAICVMIGCTNLNYCVFASTSTANFVVVEVFDDEPLPNPIVEFKNTLIDSNAFIAENRDVASSGRILQVSNASSSYEKNY